MELESEFGSNSGVFFRASLKNLNSKPEQGFPKRCSSKPEVRLFGEGIKSHLFFSEGDSSWISQFSRMYKLSVKLSRQEMWALNSSNEGHFSLLCIGQETRFKRHDTSAISQRVQLQGEIKHLL